MKITGRWHGYNHCVYPYFQVSVVLLGRDPKGNRGHTVAKEAGANMASRNVTEVIAAQAPVAGESVYDMAVQQLLASADRLGLDEGIRQILSQPKRELTVHFPVQMDNG
jgi:hypothetical protein